MLVLHRILENLKNVAISFLIAAYGSSCIILASILFDTSQSPVWPIYVERLAVSKNWILIVTVLIEFFFYLAGARKSGAENKKKITIVIICLLVTAPMVALLVAWLKL